MPTKNQILDRKLNFLKEVTEEELFNHFFVHYQKTMIKLCQKALTASRDKDVIKLASDILNVIDPDWFRGENSNKKKGLK